MPIPRKRLVISKDHGITTENIPRKTEKSTIFVKKNKTKGVMRYLSRKAHLKKGRRTQRQKDLKMHQAFKHYKTKGSFFQFRRLETLVKNRRSEMKHWAAAMQRRNNPKYRIKLEKQLRGVSILLIVRIHRAKNVPDKLLEKMRELGLFHAWDCIIVRNTASLIPILKDILPFITFGLPSKEVISDLVLKRGRLTRDDGSACVITSNVIVEKMLGKYDVICVEDIIHTLSTVPSSYAFDGVAKALNPFHLNHINIPMRGLKGPFDHLGYWGFRGTFISTFVEKLL